MISNEKIDYGNWVSASMMRMWTAATLILAIFCVICFLPFTNAWSVVVCWIARSFLLTLTAGLLLITVYFGICRRLFSYKGKSCIQSRILDYTLSYLKFDHGRVLDIGCGNGALSIKAVKKFPDSIVTGLDYWGSVWNFAKEKCEVNAKKEGVLDRVSFQKGDAAHLDFPDESFDAAVSNFVFHEVKSQPDKRLVVRETLRVVKKGGVFAFHDLFFEKKYYGDIDGFVRQLKEEGIQEIFLVCSRDEKFIPKILKSRFMLGCIGLLYGIK